MQTLGQFIVDRRKELGLSGSEVVAEMRNSDGKPISIPYLVDLEHDRRKPSDEVLVQLAKVLKSTPTFSTFWQDGFQPTSTLRASNPTNWPRAVRLFAEK